MRSYSKYEGNNSKRPGFELGVVADCMRWQPRQVVHGMHGYRLIIYFQIIPGAANSTLDVKIMSRNKREPDKKSPAVGSVALS